MNTDIFASLDKNRYFRNFKSDKKLIFSTILIILAWSLIYVLFFYKPSYKSNVKIWIKDLATKEFVTSLDIKSQLKPLTFAGNPLLTQIELLKSDKLKEAIVQYKLKQGVKATLDDVNIDVKSLPNADILLISLIDSTPEKAQETLSYLIEEYDNINLLINRKIRTSRRKYIELKLAEINDELQKAREKVKIYKSGNLAINLDVESNQLVSQKTLMSSKLEGVIAEIRNIQSSINELENQLSLNSKDAIRAVALGSGNQILMQLRKDLNECIQKYEHDSSKYADTNPKMVALKNKINIINDQIKKQVELSIGSYAKREEVNIFDPVRMNLVQKLAIYQTDLMGLCAEEEALADTIDKINFQQSKIPEKKFILGRLEQEEKVLSAAYNELKKKQIEAKIKEAEVSSNVIIVDPPSLPKGASFPSGFQVLILGLFLGMAMGLTASFLKTIIEDICDDPELIEKITGNSVIGSIPWVENYIPNSEILFIQDFAYDNLASSLITKCQKGNQKVITFTSSSFKKPQSSVVYRLAEKLKKMGASVVIIDSDFRMPTVLQNVGIESRLKTNLSDFILASDRKLKQDQALAINEVLTHLITDDKGIKHLANKDTVLESYEFFGLKAFNYIVQILKNEFDWVLIDVGAPQITPEFVTISKCSDGVVLFASKTTTYAVLKNIMKKIKNANIPFIGTIMRESDSKLEKEYKKYLRLQMEKLRNDGVDENIAYE